MCELLVLVCDQVLFVHGMGRVGVCNNVFLYYALHGSVVSSCMKWQTCPCAPHFPAREELTHLLPGVGWGRGLPGHGLPGRGVVGRGGNNVLDTTLFIVHQHELTYIYPRCALLHTPWYMSWHMRCYASHGSSTWSDIQYVLLRCALFVAHELTHLNLRLPNQQLFCQAYEHVRRKNNETRICSSLWPQRWNRWAKVQQKQIFRMF